MNETTPERERSGLLAWIERVGNRLPDPALLFLLALIVTWVISHLLDGVTFEVPTADGIRQEEIHSQLEGGAIVEFLSSMVETFAGFPPLGVVLVALLGVGVAEHSGFIDTALRRMLAFTPKPLITPAVLLVAIVSHTAADAGYVLVIPLGGVIFYAAGRHPLAGIACAFAGVSGGFSANFIPSGVDPLLQGLTQVGAQIADPAREVNPLCNIGFTAASSVLIVIVGWILTDRFIEPRLRSTPVDGDPDDMPERAPITPAEAKGLRWGMVSLLVGLALLVWACWPASSPLRSPIAEDGSGGELTASGAPLMHAIVPLIFLFFLVPGVVHGYASGRFESHRDVVKAMSKTMSTMGYYMVMAFFASLFIYAFGNSNLGRLIAVEGANGLRAIGAPATVTIVGIIALCACVNLLVGSASAKWALLSPIFVPMLMDLGIAPELTQAAYRVGDSSTNIVTPLMPYFPLVVAFSQRYVKGVGIGTLISVMLPYSIAFLVTWTAFLLGFWMLGVPLGVQGAYTYP